jgi:phosphohistidine phosphatase SixA
MTSKEKQCAEKQSANLDDFIEEVEARVERVAARADAWGKAFDRVLEADAVRFRTIWEICLDRFPRTQFHCLSPDIHAELLPASYPAEISSYGQLGAQKWRR